MKNMTNELRKNRKGVYITAICVAAVTLFVGCFMAFRAFAADEGTYIVVFDICDEEKGITDNIIFNVKDDYKYEDSPAFVTAKSGSSNKMDVAAPSSEAGCNNGYSFYKWDIGGSYYDGDSNVPNSKFSKVSDGNDEGELPVYVAHAKAVWQKDYVVNIYSGVEGIDNRIGYTNQALYRTSSTVSIPAMSYGSHSLLGWSKSENPSIEDVDYPASAARAPYEDFTVLNAEGDKFELNLYAVWVENINVTYVYDLTGDNAMPDSEDNVNPSGFTPKIPREPSGYSFVGWMTKSDGSGKTFNRNTPITLDDLVKDDDGKYKLYGIWNKRYGYDIVRVDTSGNVISSGTANPNGEAYYEQHYDESFNIGEDCYSNITGYKFIEYRRGSLDGEVITTASLQNDFVLVSNKFVLNIYSIYESEEYEIERVMQSPKGATRNDGSAAPTDTNFGKCSYKSIKEAGGFGNVEKLPGLKAPAGTFNGWSMYYQGKLVTKAHYNSSEGYYYFTADNFAGKTDGTITIKDEWEVRYHLNFDPNGEGCTFSNNYKNYINKSVNTTDSEIIGFGTSNNGVARTGYGSLGWSFTKNETTDFLITDNINVEKDKLPDYFNEYDPETDTYQATLYRQWEKKFQLNFVTKGFSSGSFTESTGSVSFERRVDENGSYDSVPFTDFDSLGNPSNYAGYTFSHWSLTDGGDEITSLDLKKFVLETEEQEKLESDRRFALTIYAVYASAEFTIEYDCNEEAVETDIEGKPKSATQTVNYNDVKDKGFVPPTLYAKGYRFDGWNYSYSNDKGGNFSGKIAPGGSLSADKFNNTSISAIKLKAVWTKLFRVHYIDNGSEKYPVTGPDEYVDVTYDISGGSYTLANASRAGEFIFYNWSKTPLKKYEGEDTKGVKSLRAEDFTGPVEHNGDWRYEATVYAVWDKQVRRIYHGNGGTTSNGKDTVDKGLWSNSSPTVDKNEFFYADHCFGYWNTEPDGSGASYNEGDHLEYLEDDLELYAIWGPDEYSLTYENVDLLDNAQVSGIPDPNVVEIKYDDFYPNGYKVTLPTALGYRLEEIEIWNTNGDGQRIWRQTISNGAESFTISKSWFIDYHDLTFKFIWGRRCAIVYDENSPREGATITNRTTMNGATFYDDESSFKEGVYTNITTWYPICKEDRYYKKGVQTFICKGWSLTDDNDESGVVTGLPLEQFKTVEKLTTSSGDEIYAHVIYLYAVWKERAVVAFHGNGGATVVDNEITGQKETVDVDYRLPSNSTTVEMNSFPTFSNFQWDGNFRLYVWNTEPDGSGTYYMSNENGNLKYLRTDVKDQKTVYIKDFNLESGVLNLYEQWGRNYYLQYHNNDPYTDYNVNIMSEDFKVGVSYPGGEVPVHELKTVSEGTIRRMDNGKSLYFLGWTWTPIDHPLAEDEEIPSDLVSSVALNDLKRGSTSSTGSEGNGEYDIDKDNSDKAHADTEIHFKLSNGAYRGDVYGVWSYKPYTLMYIDGVRKDNGDSSRPKIDSVQNMPQTLKVTELTYDELTKGYVITTDNPTAEGYTFQNWMIFRGGDESAIDYVSDPKVGYYGLNVHGGYNLGFYTFNSNNPSKTVILVANWKRNNHRISYYYEEYDLITGEPKMNGDKINLIKVTEESNVPYESEVGVGKKTENWQDVYHPDISSRPHGKNFGGWELYMVNGVEVDKEQVVKDAGQYTDGVLTYKNINLLQEGDEFNMPDEDLAFVAIYVSPQMTVTYDPGDGYSDSERTQKQQVQDEAEYNASVNVRYAVHDTAQGGVLDCGFYAPAGKVFKCWKVDTANNKSKDPYPTGEGDKIANLQNNITYTAQWEPGTFPVIYNFSYNFGGGTKPNDIVYTEAAAPGDVGGQKVLMNYAYKYEAEVTVQASPTSYESRKGESSDGKVYDASKYVFGGWTKTAPDDLTIVSGKFNMPAATVLFNGVFDYRMYTVTYDANFENQTTTESTAYDASDLSVKSFESAGFKAPLGKEFDHWELQAITDPSNNADYTSTVGETIENLRDNITYKAVYRDANYHVYYQLAEGSVDPDSDLGKTMYTLPIDDRAYVMGDVVNVMAEPKVAGYTFSGWKVKSPDGVATEKSSDTEKLLTVTMPADDVTLEGSFTRDDYTLNYVMNLNGDNTVVNTVTFLLKDVGAYGYVFDTSFAPTLVKNGDEEYYEFDTAAASHKRVPDGYTFLKWSTDRSGTGGTEPNLTFDPDTKTYEVYGIWYNWSYTLTYDANGHGTDDTIPKSQSFQFADIVTDNALISESVPTEEGYNFKSWYIENGSYSKTFAKGTDDRVVPRQLFDESDKDNCHAVAVAQWEKLYQLNFDLNGGKYNQGGNDMSTIAPVKFERDLPDNSETYTFSVPTLSNPNHTFDKWILQIKDEKGAVIEEIDVSGNTVSLNKFKLTDGRHQATLKAQWRADDQYTVKYKITGDYLTDYSSLPVEKPHYKGDKFNVAAKLEGVKGYTFHGWYYNDGTNNAIYENQQEFTMPDSNVTFTGYFTPNEYTVEYYKEDGATMFTDEPLKFDYNSEVTVGKEKSGEEIVIDKKGYRFVGWELMSDSAAHDAENKAIPTANGGKFKMPDATVKFRAVYNRLYTLVYNANGGKEDTVPASVDFEVEEGGAEVKSLDYTEGSKPKWDGHKFLYWSETTDGDRAETVAVMYNSTGYELNDNGRYVVNVYAIWQEPFTVTYSVTGDIPANYSAPDSFTKYPGESFNVAQAPKKDGYEFSGWHYRYGDESKTYTNQESFEMPNHSVEFTGSFTENVYTLYFKDSEDNADLGSQSVRYTEFMKGEDGTAAEKGGIVIKCSNPTKPGYVFNGWALSKSASAPDYHYGDRVEQNAEKGIFGDDRTATVYALWTEKTITLTYDGNGAREGYAPDSVTVTQKEALTTTIEGNNGNSEHPGKPLVLPSYRFTGWNKVKGSNNPATHYEPGTEASFTTDTVLYAEWEQIYYVELTYDANGGTNSDGGDVRDALPASEKGEKPLTTTVKSPGDNLVNHGFRFVGWKDGEGNDYNIGDEYTFTKDTVLYAQWEALPRYTVTYKATDENGDEITLDVDVYGAKQYFEGEKVTVAPKLKDKDEYIFSGWSYGGRTYGEGDNFEMPSADVELRGQYTPKPSESETFNVTYISGVSEGQPGYTSALGEHYTVSCAKNDYHIVLANDSEELNYIREGYNFIGWKKSYDEPVDGIALIDNSEELLQQGYELYVDGDITLTAVWGQYILTYDANFGEDGKGTPPEPKGYAEGTWVEVASADGLTRENATFLYWNTDRDGTGDIYYPYPHDKGKIQMNSDITLYAIWETNSDNDDGYTLTYDANGATSGVAPTDNRKHSAGDRFTVEPKGSLERSGCTFKEWNTRADGKGEGYKAGEDVFTMPNRNVTLYAIWVDGNGDIVSPGTGESMVGVEIAISASLMALIAGAFAVARAMKKRRYE